MICEKHFTSARTAYVTQVPVSSEIDDLAAALVGHFRRVLERTLEASS